MALSCCGDRSHAWEEFRVEAQWRPERLACLIIGENPGSSTSPYFYEEGRAVAVRTILLRELHRGDIITEPTLGAFRSAGFLFDHGIRCRLLDDEIGAERRLAQHYNSIRAAGAKHLEPLLKDAPAVWVMGYVARNAVAALCSEFPRDTREISSHPYPGQAPGAPRFFVSRYLTRAPRREVADIFREFLAFWKRIGGGETPLSQGQTPAGPARQEAAQTGLIRVGAKPRPVDADDLSKWRRQLLRLLDRLDGKATPNAGPMARITRLKNQNVIPRETAALMIAVTEARNAAEYGGKRPTPTEGEAVRNAWAAILDWAKTRGIVPEAR